MIGRQLGQLRPADTNAASLYSPPTTGVIAWVQSIFITNTTAGALTFRIFHDDDGTTYDQSTALYYDVSIAANATTRINNMNLWLFNSSGNLAVRSSSASGLTFTAYGIEEEI